MKRKNVAEEMFNDVISAIREKQDDLEKFISEYTPYTPKKLFIDLMEDHQDLTIKIDLPGVKKEDIKIHVTEDTLEIGAQFREEVKEEEASYLRKERNYGEVRRVIALPVKVKIDEVSSHFQDGVLTVTLPKMEKKESFEVEIE
jgi:HSP20 family protein